MADVFVYCGEDLVASRKNFSSQKEKLIKEGYEEIFLDKNNINFEILENIFSNTGLFGNKKLLCTENFLGDKKSKDKDKIIEKLSSFKDAKILIWENKEITQAEKNKYDNFKFFNYKIPSSVFKFLEGIKPKNPQNNLFLLKNALINGDESFIFLMLGRQFKNLILAKEDQLAKMPEWQKVKLKVQSNQFEINELINNINKLLIIDKNQKTSNSPYNLSSELELLVLNM